MAFAGADDTVTPIPVSRAARLRPIAGQAAARTGARLAAAARSLAPAVRRARTALFLTGAVGCAVAAAWTVAAGLGLAVAAAGLLFLEYMSGPAR